MLLNQLLHPLRNCQIYNCQYLSSAINQLTNDSRNVKENACFIAIKGENFDGHSMVSSVVEQGAIAVVVEQLPENYHTLNATIILVPSTVRAQAILANQFYNCPTSQLNVIAVTGTNGKTTTTNMISYLLEQHQHKTGVIGTLHYKVDDEIYPAINTTPNSLELQSLFSRMVDKGCKDAIIEASSHALMLGRLSYTQVDCAIFTNLTREHLDFHKTMDNYAHAKSLLFSQLGQSFTHHRAPLAIINADESVSSLMEEVTSADVATYSIQDPTATAYAYNIQVVNGKTTFELQYQEENYRVTMPIRGSYNVQNFLASFLCLVLYYGSQPEEIIEQIEHFEGVPGRMQSIQAGQDFEVIVDFAHTTDALERILSELTESLQEDQQVIALMGHSGGNRDSEARPEIGNILFKYADYVVLTADNPRFEAVSKIAQEMIGQHASEPHIVIENRHEAIKHALSYAKTGDIVVFAGKGGEPYQVIGDDYIPYNEAEVVRNTLIELIN